MWSIDGKGEPIVLRGHDDLISSVAISPDGRRVASASFDRTVRVWSIDGKGEPVLTLCAACRRERLCATLSTSSARVEPW